VQRPPAGRRRARDLRVGADTHAPPAAGLCHRGPAGGGRPRLPRPTFV